MGALDTIEEDGRREKTLLPPHADDPGTIDAGDIRATHAWRRVADWEDVQAFVMRRMEASEARSSEQGSSALVELLTDREIAESDWDVAEGETGGDPFEQLDRKKPKEKRIRCIIEQFRMSTELPFGRQLANRLEFLIEAEREQYPLEWQFSESSLIGFLEFLEEHPRLHYPDVSLSPDGLLLAQWRETSTRNAVLEFEDTGQVQFVLFAPSVLGVARISGVTSPDRALRTLEEHGAGRWCNR